MEELTFRNFHIIINRKSKNKNTYFRIKSDGTILVTCPFHIETTRIIDHLDKFIDKIEKKYDYTQFNKLDYQEGGNFFYLGEYYQIKYHSSSRQYCQLEDGYLNVYLKNTDEKNVENVIDKYIKNEAKKILESRFFDRVNEFDMIDFIPELKIKKMKSRFGTCYYKKQLVTLSTLLIHYDLDCIDYVIIHELSHFIQPNHSKKFYYLVERYCPNYKEAEKKLKNVAL